MTSQELALAQHLACLRCEFPQAVFYDLARHGDAAVLRVALRQVGVPVLELNHAPAEIAAAWLDAADVLSTEFLVPVVVFGTAAIKSVPVEGHVVNDDAWLQARQIALESAIERSTLTQEYRRSKEKTGWIRVGWQPPSLLASGNGLMLAWSSPLPLRRLRDFAARCPDLTLYGDHARPLAAEVAAQGVCASRWRFEVK